jgi:magnesium-transporting ATPase (P-type)
LPAEEIVVGDVIVLEAGNNVPADCRLIEGFGLRVNNATVTRESVSKSLNVAPSGEDELAHSKNILLAGTSVVSGHGRAVIGPPSRYPPYREEDQDDDNYHHQRAEHPNDRR